MNAKDANRRKQSYIPGNTDEGLLPLPPDFLRKEVTMAPQIILIAIWVVSATIALENHGKPRDGIFQVHNIAFTLVKIAIFAFLLWWGGFWDCFIK